VSCRQGASTSPASSKDEQAGKQAGGQALALINSLLVSAVRKPSKKAGVNPFFPRLTVTSSLPSRCASPRFDLRSELLRGCW
jgi:hypothetical protein